MADIQQLIEADKALLLSLNGSDSLFWDGFMWTVTDTRTWIPALVVLLYVIFKNNRIPQGLVIVLMFALSVTLAENCFRIPGRTLRIYFQPCGQHLCGGHVCFIAGTLFTVHVHDVSLGVDTFVFTHLSGSALSR